MSLESQPEIILASSSSFRQEIFQQMGIKFTYIKPEVVEEEPSTHKSIEQLVKDVSLHKAQSLKQMKDKIIIAFDTLVAVGDDILQKPKNAEEAKKMLQKISTQTVKVVTGVAVVDTHKTRTISQTETTLVTVARLSSAEIDWYIQTNQWQGVSGALAVEGLGSRFIRNIQGNFNNILGVPSRLVYEQLINLGYEDMLIPPPPKVEKTKSETGAHLPFL